MYRQRTLVLFIVYILTCSIMSTLYSDEESDKIILSPFIEAILKFDEVGEFPLKLTIEYTDELGSKNKLVINKSTKNSLKKVLVINEGVYQYIGYILASFANPVIFMIEDDVLSNRFKIYAEITYAAVEKGSPACPPEVAWSGILPGSVYTVIDFGDGKKSRTYQFNGGPLPPPFPGDKTYNPWDLTDDIKVSLYEFPHSPEDSYYYLETPWITEHIYTVPNFPNNAPFDPAVEKYIPTPYSVKAKVYAKFIKFFKNEDTSATEKIKYKISSISPVGVLWEASDTKKGIFVIDNTPPVVKEVFVESEGYATHSNILRVTTGEKFFVSSIIEDNNPKALLYKVNFHYGFFPDTKISSFEVLPLEQIKSDVNQDIYSGRTHVFCSSSPLKFPEKFARKPSIVFNGVANRVVYGFIEAIDAANIMDSNANFLLNPDSIVKPEHLIPIYVIDNDAPDVSVRIISKKFNINYLFEVKGELNDKVTGDGLLDRDFGNIKLFFNKQEIKVISDPETNPKSKDEIKLWQLAMPQIVFPDAYTVKIPEDTRFTIKIKLTENTLDKNCTILLKFLNESPRTVTGMEATEYYMIRHPVKNGFLKIYVTDSVFEDEKYGKLQNGIAFAIPFEIIDSKMRVLLLK